jgi:hypothetical protein
VLSSAPFELQWKHGHSAPLPAVARCIAEDQMAAYFSPRTSRPRPRAKSRPSLSHIGSLGSILPAVRARGPRIGNDDAAEAG